MKTIFDKSTREEVMGRIDTLSTKSEAQWGKMNVYQMVKHCTQWNDWVLGNGEYKYKQDFFGKIFGKMVLKGITKSEKPLGRNSPAGPFAVKEGNGEIELQKRLWLGQIAAYENFSNPDFIHDFFGKMKTDEIGIFVYKHMDHHLRQFGA